MGPRSNEALASRVSHGRLVAFIEPINTTRNSNMDLSRVLNGDNNVHGIEDSERAVGAAVVRAKRRNGKRKTPLDALREQCKLLEIVAKNVNCVTLTDEEEAEILAANGGAMDEETRRIRLFLRQTVDLQASRLHELAARSELIKHLRHARQGTLALEQLFRDVPVDEWYWQCDRFRMITDEYFTPLTRNQCDSIVRSILSAIASYEMPKEARESGLGFFGWRDTRRLEGNQERVHFISRKTFCQSNIENFANGVWNMYHDAEVAKKIILGGSMKWYHRILQRVTPNLSIIQQIEEYPEGKVTVHNLSLFVRAETETGYFFATRTIPMLDLEKAMRCDGVYRARNFTWANWDVIARDDQGRCREYQASVMGYIGGDHPGYAHRWLSEIMLFLVRAEGQFAGNLPLSIPPST